MCGSDYEWVRLLQRCSDTPTMLMFTGQYRYTNHYTVREASAK